MTIDRDRLRSVIAANFTSSDTPAEILAWLTATAAAPWQDVSWGDVRSYMIENGLVEAIAALADDVSAAAAIRGAASTIMRSFSVLEREAVLQFGSAESRPKIQAMLAALVTGEAITSADKTAVEALAQPNRPRWQIHGLGGLPTLHQVTVAKEAIQWD